MNSFTSDDGITVQSNDASVEELEASFDDATPAKPEAAGAGEPASSEGLGTGSPAATEPKPDKRTRDGKFKSIQAEIDAATAEKHRVTGETASAKAERDRLSQELADLRAQKAALALQARQTPEAEKKPRQRPTVEDDPNDPEPQEEEFDAYREFVREHGLWAARRTYAQSERARVTREQQAWQERAASARTARFQERHTAGKAKYADFDAVITAGDTPLTRPMHDVLMDSEITAELQYYLATHQDEAQAIYNTTYVDPRDGQRKFDEIQQYGLMKALEGRLSAAVSGPAPRTPTHSTAPPPIKPLRGASNAGDGDDEPDLNDQEAFDRYHNQRARQR